MTAHSIILAGLAAGPSLITPQDSTGRRKGAHYCTAIFQQLERATNTTYGYAQRKEDVSNETYL